MLVVMIFQRFLRHMGRKRVISVRQGGKRKGHGVMSANDGRRGLSRIGSTGTLIEGSIDLKHPIRDLAGAVPTDGLWREGPKFYSTAGPEAMKSLRGAHKAS
jgi:hypothetical protein